MSRVIVEFDKNFTMLAIHSDQSLSFLIGDLEKLDGVILVNTPGYNDLEVYLDYLHFRNLDNQARLKTDLAFMLEHLNRPVEYVQN